MRDGVNGASGKLSRRGWIRAPALRYSAGFTLLEVMIAFVIAGLALAALTRATAAGLAATQAGIQYEEAISRARSHLAVVNGGMALTPGDSEGDDGGGFHWRLRIVPEANTVVELPGPVGRPGLPVTLYAVSAWITWHDGATTRTIRVDTAQVGKSM